MVGENIFVEVSMKRRIEPGNTKEFYRHLWGEDTFDDKTLDLIIDYYERHSGQSSNGNTSEAHSPELTGRNQDGDSNLEVPFQPVRSPEGHQH